MKDRPGHDLRYALNSNKLNRKIKWRSITNINKGLENTFLWYLQNINYFKYLIKKDITKRIGIIK